MSVLRVEQQAQAAAHDRVVVDDRTRMLTGAGTSATTVVPAPGRDSISSRPSSSASRSRMPRSPTPSSRTPRVEAGAVVLDHRGHRGLPPRDRDADVVRVRVLDDVRERLLHDPVERRLDLARQPRLAERRVEVDANPRLLGERLGQPLERGHETEVVEHGRTQLDGEPAHVLERVDDGSRSSASAARAGWSASASSSGFRPRRIEVSACRLVVELAREPPALELLRRTTRRTASRATRWESSTATAARVANVSASRRSSSVKRASGTVLVVDLDHADRRGRGRSAAPTCRSGRRAAA